MLRYNWIYSLFLERVYCSETFFCVVEKDSVPGPGHYFTGKE